jgi:pimeloyl-ACP methyl ester carboxylesterase
MSATEFLTIDGVRLECRWIGNPTPGKPTLVFLHEGLGCVTLWRDYPDLLARQTGISALIYSRAGYGKSDPVALPRPIEFMRDEAAVLARILADYKLSSSILVGQSDGASIALLCAARSDVGGIQALVLEAPHVFTEPSGLESIARIAKAYHASNLRQRLARHHGANTDIAFWGWNDVWLHPDFEDWNIEADLPGITAPMLIIQGQKDEYGTWRQVEAIARQSGGPVQVKAIPDCGHAPHHEHREVTLASMTRFILENSSICKSR